MDVFDTIIIGAGQAGNPLSQALAKSGEQVALIEEQFVGGTCINVGCTPTKTMVAEIDRSRGLIKALVDPDSEHILGASVLGYHGGEVMAMLEIAMIGEVSCKKLRDGIFAHLTLAEGLNTLFSMTNFVALAS